MDSNELIENFSYLLDWEDKYRYLIELGEKMNPLPENERTDDYKVNGCQSQVWIKGEKKEDKFYFQAASDAIIVQGLEAVLLTFVNGKTAQEIQNLDLLGLFKSLGLEENISPTRRNGFASMVERIYALTKEPTL
jgi:cysteine desulfuration protein SufE